MRWQWKKLAVASFEKKHNTEKNEIPKRSNTMSARVVQCWRGQLHLLHFFFFIHQYQMCLFGTCHRFDSLCFNNTTTEENFLWIIYAIVSYELCTFCEIKEIKLEKEKKTMKWYGFCMKRPRTRSNLLPDSFSPDIDTFL